MTLRAEDIAVVRRGWEKVALRKDHVADRFYDHLFAAAPGIRPLFAEDLASQKRKFMTMLAIAVGALDHPDDIAPLLRSLGHRHGDLGARPEHYPVVEAALLRALAEGLGADFDDTARRAWSAVYGLITAHMLADAA